MFKFIVLCAFIAVAAGEPGALLYQAPITQYSSYVQPAATTIWNANTGLLPTQYSFGYPHIAHYIKKRSAQALDLPTTYWANSWPQVYNQYAYSSIAPASYIAPTSYIAPAASNVHFIKKRSAQLLPTTYLASSTYTAASPLLTTSYSAASPLITSPLIPSTNLYSSAYPYLIKK